MNNDPFGARSMYYTLLNVDPLLGSSLETPFGPTPLPDPLTVGTDDDAKKIMFEQDGNVRMDLDFSLFPLPEPLPQQATKAISTDRLLAATTNFDVQEEATLAENLLKEKAEDPVSSSDSENSLAAACANDLIEMRDMVLKLKEVCVSTHELNVVAHQRLLQFQESLRMLPFLTTHIQAWSLEFKELFTQETNAYVDALSKITSGGYGRQIQRGVYELKKTIDQWEVASKIIIARIETLQTEMKDSIASLRQTNQMMQDDPRLTSDERIFARQFISLLDTLSHMI
jgi:hypothetical protein